jgi:uncharacterized membrane protein
VSPLLALVLFLHVMGAIVTFGPTFIFPIIASQAQKSPPNGAFAAALSELIERRVVIPGAIVQGITGVLLILILGVNPLTDAPWRWLLPAIVLYLIAILFAIFVQARNAEKMVHLTSSIAPGGPPPAETIAEIQKTGQALQRGGMLLSLLVVLIVILMVTKPTIG